MNDEMTDAAHLTGDLDLVYEVFEAMPTLMAALEGPEHHLVAANGVYRTFAGRAAFLGRPAREVFPDIGGQQLFELLDQVYATGEAVTSREWRLQMETEELGQTEDIYLDFTLTAWTHASGEVRGILINQADVTERVHERRKAQQRADEAEERYRVARDVVAQVQEALLPTGLPVLPGVDIAARYLVAADDQAAGGDWFDAVPLPDGSVALVVGDVVGHGVQASAGMAQARAVLAEVLSESGDLEHSLMRIDRLATRVPGLRTTTLCVAVMNPVDGEVRYSTCGHPAPLIISPDGPGRYLPASGGGPLGTGSPPVIASTTVQEQDVLLLFSDGMVERPGQDLEAGLSRLSQVAADAVTNTVMPVGAATSAAERVCMQSVEILTRGGYDDDVTALAAQRRAVPVEPLHQQVTATLPAVPQVRETVRQWLAQLEPTRRDATAVELAVTELVANAAKHAYPPGQDGTADLRAELTRDGVLELTVTDHGTWRQPADPEAGIGGRGLWLTGAVLDELWVERSNDQDAPREEGSDGTVVRGRHRLQRPAVLASEPVDPAPGVPLGQFSARLEEGPPRTLWVSGPVDVSTATEFSEHLSSSGRGGIHPLVVDLSGVEALGSPGVSALFDARSQHDTYDQPLTLVATPGSVAAQVLELVGLAYVPEGPGTGKAGPSARSE